MYLLAGIYFLYLNLLILINKKYGERVVTVFYFIFFITIIFFLSSYIEDISRDFYNYKYWFDEIYYSSFSENITGKDPGFKSLINLIQTVFGNNYIYIYMVYMFLIFYFKYKYCETIFSGTKLIIFFWIIFSSTFVLYELTQIRVGLAIAFSSYIIVRNLYLRSTPWTWFFLILSYFFHQSILILLISYLAIYLLKGKVVNRFFISGMLLFGLFVNLFLQEKLSNIVGLYLMSNERAENYLNGVEDLSSISLFSFFFILKIVMIVILLLFWEYLSKQRRMIVFFSALGCFFYMVFMFNGVFALRISELFILFSLACFIFPLEIKIFDKNLKYVWILFLSLLGGIFLYSSSKILLEN